MIRSQWTFLLPGSPWLRFTGTFLFLLAGFPSLILYGQSKLVSGKVMDDHTSQPLPFATIGIRGTHTGTASNFEGKFILEIPEHYSDSVLVCSYVGYKDFQRAVKPLGHTLEIRLVPEVVYLETVEIRPLSAWDYIQRALQNIPENYSAGAYMSQGYYSESLSENNNYLKYTEAVVETYNPVYGDTAKCYSKILQARRKENLSQLQFMRDKMEKEMKKEQKKNKDTLSADDPENIDEAIVKASFGGPDQILGADPIKDTADFLKPGMRKKFRYTIEGYSTYFGENAIIIGYESRGKMDHQKIQGNIYISLTSDAIMAIDYENRVVIPDIIRPVIFVMGYGVTDPVIKGKVHYRPVNKTWYLNDISIEGSVQLTKKKTFKKNDRSLFHFQQSLINTGYNSTQVRPVLPEERYKKDKALEEQVEEDPEFWESYRAARPID